MTDNEITPQAPVQPVREDVLLDEIGKKLEAQREAEKRAAEEAEAKRKLELEAKLRPAEPDKSVEALREALRISEESRRRTEEMLKSISSQPPPSSAPPQQQPEMTREQLNELYAKDPLAAIELMMERSAKTLMENVAKRVEPLLSSSTISAREMARSKFPDEFEVLGPEIEKMLNDPRVNKSAMSSLQAWEDLIYYVRGQPGNMEKLLKHREARESQRNAHEAREAQAAQAGAHTKSEVRPPSPTGQTVELDEVAKEIARTIFSDMEPAEAYKAYKEYMRVT